MSVRDKIYYLAAGSLLTCSFIAGMIYFSKKPVIWSRSGAYDDVKRVIISVPKDIDRICGSRWKTNYRMRDYCVISLKRKIGR